MNLTKLSSCVCRNTIALPMFPIRAVLPHLVTQENTFVSKFAEWKRKGFLVPYNQEADRNPFSVNMSQCNGPYIQSFRKKKGITKKEKFKAKQGWKLLIKKKVKRGRSLLTTTVIYGVN